MSNKQETYYLGLMKELTIKDDGDPTLYVPVRLDNKQIGELSAFVADPEMVVVVVIRVSPLKEDSDE